MDTVSHHPGMITSHISASLTIYPDDDVINTTGMYAKLAVLICVLMFIIPGNILTITAILKYSWLQSPANGIICLLAVADLLMSLSVGVHIYETLNPWVYHTRYYLYIETLSGLVAANAGIHINMVAVDRSVAILMPLRYSALMTPRTIALMEVTSWLLSVLVIVVPFAIQGVHGTISGLVTFVFFMGNAVMAVFLHFRVTKSAREQSNRIQPSGVAGVSVGNVAGLDKATKMFLWLVGLLFLLWMPFMMAKLIGDVFDIDLQLTFEFVFYLGQCNSGVNVFVYAFVNSKFKKAYKMLLTGA